MTRRRLPRRAVLVTFGVTVVDLITLLWLVDAAEAPVLVADAIAVALASALSWVLHRTITFGRDPFVRWVDSPSAFLCTAVVAGVFDVAIVSLAAPPDARLGELLAAKAVALVLAGGVRLVAYRAMLLTSTRSSLSALVQRPDPPGTVRLTVVVPAYGEAERIATTVAALTTALAGVVADGGLEVLVVDDGSADDTAARAEGAGARVLRHPANRGKGAAVRTGMLAAEGRAVAFVDADLAYPPAQVATLLAKVEEGWDVVMGSRRHPRSTDEAGTSALRTLSGRMFNLLTAAVLLGQYRDTQCGLKAFRSDAARSLFSKAGLDGFAFDVEVLHLVERDRLSLVEVPVTLVGSAGSTVRVGVDAVQMVRDLFLVRRWAAQGRYDVDLVAQHLT